LPNIYFSIKGSDFRKEYRVSGTELSTNECYKTKRAVGNHEHSASGTQLADKTHYWQLASPTRNRQRALCEGRRL